MRALVLEGGAMRGIFTAGVLDVFAEQGEPAFDYIVGVSAGACCAASYLAGQRNRNYTVFLEYLTDRRFMCPPRHLLGGSAVDMAYLLGPVSGHSYALDVSTMLNNAPRFEAVGTDAATGSPGYLPVEAPDALDALHATSAIPIVYRGAPVKFRGRRYFDGAASDPVPWRRALDLGAEDVTVIVTRPRGWRARPASPLFRAFSSTALRNFPAMAAATERYDATSNAGRRFGENLPAGLRLRVFYPPEDFQVSRFTRDPTLLHRGYSAGRQAAASGGIELAR